MTKAERKEGLVSNYNSVADIERQHRGYWFSLGAKRFFRSRIGQTVYQGPGGIYFVSSEQFDASSPRRYTTRRYVPETDEIETIGEFNELTRSQAIALAKRKAGKE